MSSPYEDPYEDNLLLIAASASMELDPVAAVETKELARNWGWVMAIGWINLVGGVMALCSPFTATVAILGLLVIEMILLGSLNMCGVFFLEKSYKAPAFIVGLVLAVLGFLMATNAMRSITLLTILVAVTFMVEGIYRSTLGLWNRDLPGWKSVLGSGLFEILLSAVIIALFSAASQYTLGILLGINWVIYGVQRIALGLLGRDTANKALDKSMETEAEGGDYVDAP